MSLGLESDAGALALDQRFKLRVVIRVISTPSDDLTHVLQAAVSDAGADLVLSHVPGRNSCRESYRAVRVLVGVQFVQHRRKL